MQLMWQNKGRLRVMDSRDTAACLYVAGAVGLLSALLFLIGASFAREGSGLVAVEKLNQAKKQLATSQAQLEEQEGRLRAYSAMLSRMQAHIIRLDALGQQVTSSAGLDPRDFSFDEPPALGGRDPVDGSHSQPQAADFDRSLAALSKRIQSKQHEMHQLSDLILNNQSWRQIRPDEHPVSNGYISSYFGRRTDPLSGHSMLHKGLDYAAPTGSDVVAVADGVVTTSRPYGGFGNFVEITHGRGLVTRYAHNQRNLVKAGERVERGQVIALLGSTGRATGPNLHFEVLQDGEPVDPMVYISKTSPSRQEQ